MSLFQNSVLNKYLKGLETSTVNEAYQIFTDHFHNPVIQENIRNSNEEQYQGEFLIDLFVKVLGYTKNPTPDFNLTTELKNIKGSKKTDGAILKGDKALAVIELKGTNTTDLSKVEIQAFGYKNNQPGCNYVITSNFEKLRFYIDNAVDFEEFNLFQLTKERFNILWLCLSADYLLKDIPKKIKDESLTQEENITKKLYKDYALFRNEIFDAIQKENPTYNKLILFKKTQKLLDRFLFIFFAEDRLLLPPNSIRAILNQWTDLRDKYDEYFPLYDRFKKYFGYMNTGHKGQKHDIFAYNGGLFAPDEILDNININDELLYKHTLNLSNYDFESEVSVNILGHIFEHSLNDIDEIQAEIQGIATDQSKTKRKKDGVFYTPKYITKYIVDNTVGKLCEEKKTELDIQEADYEKERKGRQKDTIKKLAQKLEDYRKWLLQITICDPACGSGAFLNQALEFLIAEHQYIDELQAKLFGDAMVLSEVENAILENNLFGVDINEESIEIAKLSLWLRTAQKGRKLTSLNNNIKCGNSLIDDKKVAGERAFNWLTEFPQIFANGGFNVVIGNPPYVRVQSLKEHYLEQTLYLENKFKSATGKYDLYVLFMEKSYELINSGGIISFILPHKFLISDFGEGIRGFLSENNAVNSLIHFGSKIVFKDASTYTCIINISKYNQILKFAKVNPEDILDKINFENINISGLNSEQWLLKNNLGASIIQKISTSTPLKDICEGIYQGLITTGDDIFMLEGEVNSNLFNGFSKALNKEVTIEADILKSVLKGQDIKRYLPLKSNKFVIYPHEVNSKNKTVPMEQDEFYSKFPRTAAYLENFKDELIEKKIRYKTNPKYWYALHRSREIYLFEKDYLITPQLQNKPSFTIKETDVYADAGGYLLLPKQGYNTKSLLAILNSKILWYYIKMTSSEYAGGYFYFKTKYLEPFGIPIEKIDLMNFEDLVNKILSLTKSYFKVIDNLISYIENTTNIQSVPKKLENWNDLEFSELIKELNKAIKKSGGAILTKKDEFEWLELFEDNKKNAQELQAQIAQTENAIDEMVYDLYGLTAEEREIVENS